MNEACRQYWSAFLRATGRSHAETPDPPVDDFGDNPDLADYLVGLVLEGKKTASCGLLVEYEQENQPLPKVGDVSLFVNGAREPVCVAEVTEVFVKPFREIDAAFAYDEGEDDRTYASWRREHVKYFTRTLQAIGLVFDEGMLTVCERFKVLHRKA
ncbi:MAG: ASCH domain-containing protein [Opitutales bacterium]